MSTTIDSLQIEIQSNSNNAASSIDELAKALKKLNKNGDVSTAVTDLNELRKSLHAFVNMPSSASKIESLANSLKSLKKVGSIDLGKSIGGVKTAMESLKNIDVDGIAPQIERIGEALAPLNSVKGSGFNAMMNGFKKMNEVVKSMDSATIDRFVEKIKELDEKLGPVSQRLVAIGNAFKGINSKTLTASGGMSVFGGQVNTTTLNLQSLISVAQNVRAALQPIINLLKYTIGEAIEWDGIEYQFGNSFGEDADKYHDKIVEITDALKINKQTFMENSAMATSMLKGFGVDSADAREMGVGYTELAYDIWAAFNNVYKSFDGADGAMAAVRSAIAGEVEPIRRAGFTIVDSQLAITAANHDLEYSSQKATEAQKSYLRYLTLVDQAHAKGIVGTYASEMDKAEGMVRTFTQQLKSLAQTFGSLFLPILVKVMPWLQAFVDLLGDAVMAVANFFGVDVQKVDFSDSNFGGLSDSADSATESIGGTSKALKELKNATLGIDELNVISPHNAGNGGGGGTPSPDTGYEGLDISSIWDKSIFDQVQIEVDAIKEKLKEALSGIEAVVSGFALAIGAILVLSANPKTIALGIGLLAVGAVGMAHAIAANWDGMSEQLAETLTTVTSTVGGFLLALGAMLTFTGANVGLGIGMMAAGAVSLATAVTINWKFLNGDLENTLSILTGIVSGGALALGAVLAFSGAKVGLGIALMAAGAAGLATAAALNWDSLSTPTRKAIGTIGSIAGGALLAIGLIISLTGGALPLGIGLMAAGAASLASAVVLNWNSLTGKTKEKVATITAIASGALLGVGAVLAFSGAALPLGIGMMLVGAAGLVASAPINWSTLSEKIKKVTKEIGFAVGASLLALGSLLAFTGVATPIGVALMAAGAVGLVAGVALNWNSIVTSIKNTLQKIGVVAGASMLALGLLLVCTGVGIPLGIALIGAGAASLVSGVALNWDSIVNSVKKTVGKIGDAWNQMKGKISSAGTAVKDWWNKNMSLKAISAKVDDFKGKVSSAWSTAKQWWDNKKSALKQYTPSIGSIKDKLSTAWNTAKNWWTKNVKLSIPSLSFKVTYTEVTGWKKAIVSALGLQGWPKLSFAANGGIFDTGSLVWAGEAGPEIVANAGGGKTGVMNVQQMSDAVYEGVYSAVVAAMRSSGGNGNGAQSVNVYLDGKQITATVEKRQAERGATLMTGGVAYGY